MNDLQSFINQLLKEIKLTNNDDVENKIDYDIVREITELVKL